MMPKMPGYLPEAVEIRDFRPGEAAALFVVHAAIAPAEAGQLLEWSERLEESVETGGLAWVAAGGQRLAGYAVAEPVPGLPGVYDLTGGIVPSRRRQGLGDRLLRHAQTRSAAAGVRRLSCQINGLEDEPAPFLLRRGFFVEHEECLLELTNLDDLPPIPDEPEGALVTFPAPQAIGEFCRVYDGCFRDTPWSQPYTEAEVAAALVRPDDLIFLSRDGEPAGVVWHELLPDRRGRIEPIGIVAGHRGRGYGRRLLVAALHNLRRRGAHLVEIGLWRQNTVAMNLYKSLGFIEARNWYYLACDLEGLNAA
jgi:ribosomal protein S18 acetylase RimI-like enzyme